MIKRSFDIEVGQRLLKSIDFLALSSISLVLCLLFKGPSHVDVASLSAFFSLFLSLLCIYIARRLKLYDVAALGSPFSSTIASTALFAVLAFCSTMALRLVGYVLPPEWLLSWTVLVSLYVVVTRIIVWFLSAAALRSGNMRQRVVIVGGEKPAADAINILQRSVGQQVEIVGMFDDRQRGKQTYPSLEPLRRGLISDLAAFHRENPVDLVIIAIPLSAETRLLQILKSMWELPVDIRISGQSAQLRLSPKAYSYLGELPLLAVFDRPLNVWSQFVKDTLDRLIALFAIVIFAPVLAAVACAVKYESKGSIIFKQKRYGFNNELIEVFKFRSMYVDLCDAQATRLVTKGDPRVTKVGRFIRKTSLDELPQLFNVLMGNLSLVGPRPHATQAKAAGGLYDEVVDGYFARHKVKPGITGWAQINGWRGETDTVEKIEQRVKFDLEYINRWSLWLDLYILAKTPFALLKNENAY